MYRGECESTWNKEIGWLRTFYLDLLAPRSPCAPGVAGALEEALLRRGQQPRPRPERRRGDAHPQGTPEPAWPKVQVAMLTGLDLAIQFGLRWADDVTFDTRTVRGWRRKGRRRERKPYYVPMSDDLAAVLRALPSRPKSPWVFPNTCGTGPEDGSTSSAACSRRLCVRARSRTSAGMICATRAAAQPRRRSGTMKWHRPPTRSGDW